MVEGETAVSLKFVPVGVAIWLKLVQPEQLRITHGRLLTRDAGNVVFTRIFDADTGDFISQTVSGEKGPHPDLDSDFELFCDVVIPALS